MKKYFVIFSVLVLFVVIYIFQEMDNPQNSDTAGYISIFSDDFSADNISKISFYHNSRTDKGLELGRDQSDNSKWVVTTTFNARGKKSDIDKLLEDLKSLEGEERASGVSLFSAFDIEDEKGYNLVLSGPGGNVLHHLIIGKKGPSYNNSFIRFKDKDIVYLSDKNLRNSFGIYSDGYDKDPDSKKWIDMMVASVKKEEIVNISLKNGGKEILFEKKIATKVEPDADKKEKKDKKEDEWIIKTPQADKPIDTQDVNSLLSSVSNLRGSEIVDPGKKDEYGLKKPLSSLIITTRKGEKHTLNLGKSKDNKTYYIQKDNENTIYVLPEYTWKSSFDKVREISEKS